MTGRLGPVIRTLTAPELRLAQGWRNEHKYTLSYKLMLENYFRLRTIMEPDVHAHPLTILPTRPRLTLPGYTVVTLYWDGIERKGFWSKMSGNDQRYRYRLRYYPAPEYPELLPEYLRLERKHRAAGASYKEGIWLSREEAAALINRTDYESRAAVLARLRADDKRNEFISQFAAEQTMERLEPQLFVIYDRIPLTYPVGKVRVTFDTNLRVAPYSLRGGATPDLQQALLVPGITQPIFEPNRLIMEVKYTGVLPRMLALLLEQEGMPLEAISKYIYCVQKST